MNCPCCGREMASFDTIRKWSPEAREWVYAWTVYRCSWCAGESEDEGAPTARCACDAIYNDGPADQTGYGCDL